MVVADAHIVVVGAMGVGKSTLAEGLATGLARPHLDSDRAIEAATRMTGREIAERDGVDALHDLEVAVLLEQLRGDIPAVVSAAAAVVDSSDARAAMVTHTVLWLDLPVADLLERIATGRHRRPISGQVLTDLDTRRRPHLVAVADHRLDAAAPPHQVLARALAIVERG